MACRDLGSAKCAGTQTASAAGVMALPESFLEPLVAGDQMASLASLSPWLHLFRHLEGSLAWGPSLLFSTSGTLRGTLGGVLLCGSVHQSLKGAPWVVLLCSSVGQAFDGPASLLSSCQRWHVGEIGYGDGSTPYM